MDVAWALMATDEAPLRQAGEGRSPRKGSSPVIDGAERRRAAKALRRANDFAADVIETANVMFVQCDPAGIVLRMNTAAERITGYPRAELEGKHFEMVVPRDRYAYRASSTGS
jgi:PAS domain-containing protein